MSTKARAIIWLAPVAPPCFTSRDQWISYLQSAAEAMRADGSIGPLIYAAGVAVAFNPRFNFCVDCDAAYAGEMRHFGDCQPDHLKTAAIPTREEEVA